MSSTIYLDPTTWDLAVTATGDIAVATEPYAAAQDAASAIRTFAGEVYYDQSLGVPYWASVLGKSPSASRLRAYFTQAAMTVPDVASAQVFFSAFDDRQVSGQVQVTTSAGTSSAGF